MIQGFPTGVRVHLLRIVRTRADDIMRVMTSVKTDRLYRLPICDFFSDPKGEVDERLALILGRVFFRVGFQNRTLGFSRLGKRHGVSGFRSIKDPGYNTIFTLINGRGRPLAAHAPIDSFNGEFSGMGGGKGFPTRNLTLAGLPRRDRGMQSLLNRLIHGLCIQPEQRANAGGCGGP